MSDIDKDFIKKLRADVENEINRSFNSVDFKIQKITSRQYDEFRKTFLPKSLTIYEKLCNFSEKALQLKPSPNTEKKLKDALNVCHLNCTPSGVASFAILGPIIFIFLFSFIGYMIPVIIDNNPSGGLFFIFFGVLLGIIAMIPLNNYPVFLAKSWRMRASNQIILAIFYIATYMRSNSNLELAIDFAAEHLSPPLSLDLKKLIWDVETEKYSSIKESIDEYLLTWKDTNMEFVESMHLIESSLYETFESRRLDALDKSLSVILEETEEKMMHYAHNLKTPLNTLNMLGIVLPVLGLVILPLMVSFMESVKWYHIGVIYNFAIPIIVYYLGKSILATRPSGYGNIDLTSLSNNKKYKNIVIKLGSSEIVISPLYVSVIVFSVLFFIGIIPLLIHFLLPGFDIVIYKSMNGFDVSMLSDLPKDATVLYSLLGYRVTSSGRVLGPFGLGATLLSLFVPLAFAFSVGLYYRFRSKNINKLRSRTKKLEAEFASAIFQLGNRLGDGLPPEIAFGKVARIMDGTETGKFFNIVSNNIRKLGLSVEDAIFSKTHGAIHQFPSNLIETSMKILIESSKKGSRIASNALINISNYVKQMHRVDTRLRDLMTDVVSSMKAQIKFLTPVIAGVVIGITSMITTILGSLTSQMENLSNLASSSAEGMSVSGLLSMFNAGVPTYYFQIIIGLYVVELVFILTIIVNGIIHGSDKINEEYLLGVNLLKSPMLYSVIAGIVILLFNIIASSILAGIMG